MAAALILLSCVYPESVGAQGETRAQLMRKGDPRHTAIMHHGTYSSPMSWDRKTIIITDEGQIIKEEIYAPNGVFYAVTDPTACETVVFGVEKRGIYGRRVERWTMPGCLELLGLSGDGDRLVLGRRTMGREILSADPDQVVLTFIERGEVIREVRLGEIAPDLGEAQDADTGMVWGRYKRLNAAGHYVIEAMDGTATVFDVRTGERVVMGRDEKGDIGGWHRYIDLHSWFELQYPDDCKVTEQENFEGYVCNLWFSRGDAEWRVWTEMEQIADHLHDDRDSSTFIEFAIDQAKLMNQADGPMSTLYADSVLSQTLFTNSHGIMVLEFLLEMVHAEWTEEGEEMEERSVRGPIYAVLLAPNPDEPRNVLFLSPAYGVDDAVGSDGILRLIVDSIRYP